MNKGNPKNYMIFFRDGKYPSTDQGVPGRWFAKRTPYVAGYGYRQALRR